MTDKPIPASVLDLLRHRWVTPDGYCAFDSVFHGEADEGSRLQRQIDPAYYHYGPGGGAQLFGDMTFAEAQALHREHVFGEFSGNRNGHISVNEHAQHALQDFCREVYAAWKTYQDRIDVLRGTCMPVGRMTDEQIAEMERLFNQGGSMTEYRALIAAASNPGAGG
jgi:hypothetical protein